MTHDLLFPPPAMLRITRVAILPGSVIFEAASPARSACCPSCGSLAGRVHSRYMRTVDDLPMHGWRVRLRLSVRRFFCDNEDCRRCTFSESFDGVAERYARKTGRLTEALCEIGFACGGEGGSRLAAALGMIVSGDTLLDLIRRCPVPALPELLVLGVDDWAWRRGLRYGTILCDLLGHQPVDLLVDRSAESVSAWLRERPEVRTISRDRAGCYADGCAKGAPQAVQVADRFHLLANARDALVRVLERHDRDIREALREVVLTPELPAMEGPHEVAGSQAAAEAPLKANSAARDRRLARYRQVIDLHEKGLSLREIGQHLQMDRGTVARFVRAGQFPERANRPYEHGTDRFENYLRQRWKEGCHNAGQLCRELRMQGYRGSTRTVRRCIAPWKAEAKRGQTLGRRKASARPSPRCMAWLLLRAPTERSDEEARLAEALCEKCPEIRMAAHLAREFREIVRERKAADLDNWILRAAATETPRELRRFAQGLLQDEGAVRAALSSPWSNGQVEGQVNRLKLIKRMMYGRGGFELLRRRVLHRPARTDHQSVALPVPVVRGSGLQAAAA
jgi:transposase